MDNSFKFIEILKDIPRDRQIENHIPSCPDILLSGIGARRNAKWPGFRRILIARNDRI
jgi:hypothetical protein